PVWGDTYGNRVDRFLAGVAYLDGERPGPGRGVEREGRAGVAAQAAVVQLRGVVGRRPAARAARPHHDQQVELGAGDGNGAGVGGRLPVEQRDEGDAVPVGGHPGRLAGGGDLAVGGQQGAADLHDDDPDGPAAVHADARPAVPAGGRVA